LVEELGLITGSAYGGSMTGLDDGTLLYSPKERILGGCRFEVRVAGRQGVAVGLLAPVRGTGNSQ